MRKIAAFLRFRGIRVRTYATILPIFMATLAVVLVFSYSFSKQKLELEIERNIVQQLERSNTQIASELNVHTKNTEVFARTVEQNAKQMNVDAFRVMTENVMKINPETLGFGVYFEPYQYQEKTQYFATNVVKQNKKFVHMENSDPSLKNYTEQEWYIEGKKSLYASFVAGPFYDEKEQAVKMTTSVPFYDIKSSFQGVIKNEFNLSNIQNSVRNIKVGTTGWAFLLDSKGQYLAAPDKEKHMKLNITKESNTSLARAGEYMMEREEGQVKYTDGQETYQIQFQKVPKMGWYVGLVISESELYAPLKILLQRLIIIGGVGMVVAIAAIYLYTLYIIRNIDRMNKLSKLMSTGDFTQQVSAKSKDEFGEMARNFNQMIDNVKGLLNQVAGHTLIVASTAEQLTANTNETAAATQSVTQAMQEVAAGSDEQMQSSVETSRSMEEMMSSIHHITESAEVAIQSSEQAVQQAKSGNAMLQSVVDQMKSVNSSVQTTSNVVELLGKRSNEISVMTSVIANISKETNILSLNASIEAMRAGAQGKGFAVVAAEVRKLSENTKAAATNIADLVEAIQSDIRRVVEVMEVGTKEVAAATTMVNQTGEMFHEIVRFNERNNNQIEEVFHASEQITAGAKQVAESLLHYSTIARASSANSQAVASTSEEQLASMQEIASSATVLAKLSDELQSIIGKFKI
ncbi:methyl-accepting chemotaxis protein [Paenibacillus sp. N1-5-1-14]|uniref:methyl-accepting chemotaxis protein n=1 Tax=Paenibacillus radicibacter TaxID=2972488 RepID=UPI0021594107|nr:methyl-accepting chemotaxis protein [Paenibacillus radicibacter]MCR8643585.1 methyl-accepting chemotaxis protein [Paenibacillus radicibacter]